MNKLLPFIFIGLNCVSFISNAQNLVPNPGFEMLVKVPVGSNRGIHNTKYWRTPTFASPDYYHAEGDNITGIPKNDFGIQSPHSGKAYAGICITKRYIEYLAVNLTDTLEKGHEYQVEFYISRADRSATSVDEFGVLFTNRIKWSLDKKGIAQRPDVDFIRKKKYKVKKEWIRLSATYKAEGFETTIIVGHFIYDHPRGYSPSCHYYIDDVSVTPLANESDEGLRAEIKDTIYVTDKKEEIPGPFAPEVGRPIVLKNIFFASNESELLPGSFAGLDKLAHYLDDNLNAEIEISGHTDNTGSEEQNKKLSEERAKAIFEYLVSKGVNSSRIRYRGYGSSKPIAANNTEEGRQLNRRVEFTVIKK